MADPVFDFLAKKIDYDTFGTEEIDNKVTHLFPMYSLQKIFDDEPTPSSIGSNEVISTPKLDGAAIALVYQDGILVQAGTRGRDGITGEDITDKAYMMDNTIPRTMPIPGMIQIRGEVVCDKSIENARNYAAGTLRLKSAIEFSRKETDLYFIAYDLQPYINKTYSEDMRYLEDMGMLVVTNIPDISLFRTDGTVYRINNNKKFYELGYTAKHPRGAYAWKRSEDVEVKETILRDVLWQVGRSGQITPVAIFDEIIIDDARITRATLHNVGFIKDMDLDIGDTILITRSGGIIPKVIGKI